MVFDLLNSELTLTIDKLIKQYHFETPED